MKPPLSDLKSFGYVPKSRKIATGSGIKGGGYLHQDLYLCLKYGDEAGTVVEGNDPRLSNKRECNAPLTSTLQAEEGTWEGITQWSPVLIHGAIDGWWKHRGANFGKDFIQSNTRSQARSKLGLGSASQYNVEDLPSNVKWSAVLW